MNKLKSLWQLFFSMMKIGLFTFGGGYAMIHLLDNEFVEKKKWLSSDEFMDLVTVAESTPGPIAVNMATFVGSSQGGFLGALVATLPYLYSKWKKKALSPILLILLSGVLGILFYEIL